MFRLFLLALPALALLSLPAGSAEPGVVFSATETSVTVWLGETAQFSLNVTNTGNSSAQVWLNITGNELGVASFAATGTSSRELTMEANATATAQVLVTVGARTPWYNLTVNAASGGGEATLGLSVALLYIELGIAEVFIPEGYATRTFRIGEPVIFRFSVQNSGTAAAEDARLYLFGDRNGIREPMVNKFGTYYAEFLVPPPDQETTVVFIWEVAAGEWTNLQAQVNPSCDEARIIFGCDEELNRLIDEGGNYDNNHFPREGFLEFITGQPLEFPIIPDFLLSDIAFDPARPQSGDSVKVTVTIVNLGQDGWSPVEGEMAVRLDDGRGELLSTVVAEPLPVDGQALVIIHWQAPEVERDTVVTLRLTIDASGDIHQLDEENDSLEVSVLIEKRSYSWLWLSLILLTVAGSLIVIRRHRSSPPVW